MVRINFQNNITKANADTFNTLQDNIEDAIQEENILLTNYVDNKLTYSTDEKVVGTWIDGKPLYRKVIPITNPQSSNTNYENVSGLNISSLVHLYGFYKGASGNTFDIPFHDSESNYSVVFLSDAGYIRGRFGNPTSISEIKVIIEYTKTTD